MSKLFDETMQGLLEAVQIEKGNIPLTEHKGLAAPTFRVKENDKELIDMIIEIRKKENISQVELAKVTGYSQQAISRFEKRTHSPSLNLYANIVNALGYKVQLVRKA